MPFRDRYANTAGIWIKLAAIDDVVCRGKKDDWIELRSAALSDPTVIGRIRKVCEAHLADLLVEIKEWGSYRPL